MKNSKALLGYLMATVYGLNITDRLPYSKVNSNTGSPIYFPKKHKPKGHLKNKKR